MYKIQTGVHVCTWRLYNKTHSARQEKSPFMVLVNIVQEILKITRAIATALD